MQLISRYERGLHFLQIALHNGTGPGYVLRVAAIVDYVQRARQAHVEGRSDIIDQSRLLTQIPVKPGRIESAPQDMIAQLQGIVIGIRPDQPKGLSECCLVLDTAGIRDSGG